MGEGRQGDCAVIEVTLGYDTKANWGLIPPHMREGLQLYLESGVRPGSFLSAVLCNNLMGAVACADETNINRLPGYIRFLHNYVDPRAFGNEANFRAWMERRKKERKAEVA